MQITGLRDDLRAGLRLACRVVNRNARGPEGRPDFPVLVAYVGDEGFEITLDADITPGDLVSLERVPGTGAESACHARVVWVRRNAMPILGRLTAGLASIMQDKVAGANGRAGG